MRRVRNPTGPLLGGVYHSQARSVQYRESAFAIRTLMKNNRENKLSRAVLNSKAHTHDKSKRPPSCTAIWRADSLSAAMPPETPDSGIHGHAPRTTMQFRDKWRMING